MMRAREHTPPPFRLPRLHTYAFSGHRADSLPDLKHEWHTICNLCPLSGKLLPIALGGPPALAAGPRNGCARDWPPAEATGVVALGAPCMGPPVAHVGLLPELGCVCACACACAGCCPCWACCICAWPNSALFWAIMGRERPVWSRSSSQIAFSTSECANLQPTPRLIQNGLNLHILYWALGPRSWNGRCSMGESVKRPLILHQCTNNRLRSQGCGVRGFPQRVSFVPDWRMIKGGCCEKHARQMNRKVPGNWWNREDRRSVSVHAWPPPCWPRCSAMNRSILNSVLRTRS